MRLTLTTFLISLAVVVAAVGWTTDNRSCARTNAIRADVRSYFSGSADRARLRLTDPTISPAQAEAARAAIRQVDDLMPNVQPLRCGKLIPQTAQGDQPPAPAAAVLP